MNNNNNEDDDIESLTDIEEEVLDVVIAIKIYEKQQCVIKRQCYTGQFSEIEFVQELLNGHPDRMDNMFCIDKEVFIQLCYTLEHLQLLDHDRHVCIKEAVAMCLYILSLGAVIRVVSECFQRSVDTVFTHFKRVLKALCIANDSRIFMDALNRLEYGFPCPEEVRFLILRDMHNYSLSSVTKMNAIRNRIAASI
ncbi:hypothetical protein CICLE_v10013533mg [Citrus x clementina]|uniref:DUF8040 domain-containing protein n=1 Tax=Citrus clementina TaxID=85681 RepID=V4SP24_CITCL|nr:hypothetical protein CICLE_v10013533mg [Citrus x clementina]